MTELNDENPRCDPKSIFLNAMNPQEAIDFSREAIKTCMLVGGPILAASLLIGLIVGVFQAMTQVQDQTVSFVPKILLLLLMIGLFLPWLTQRMVDFSTESFSTPMTHWGNSPIAAEQFSPPQAPTLKQSPSSKLPFNTASIALPSLQRAKTPASSASFVRPDLIKPLQLKGEAGVDTFGPIEMGPKQPVETTSPFILPHYRFSEAPSPDIEG